MNLDLDQVKRAIPDVAGPVRIEAGTTDGPEVYDRYNNRLFEIEVGHAVWTCQDEQDGCPEVAWEAVQYATWLATAPDLVKELVQELERSQRMVQDLERDLEEAERS